MRLVVITSMLSVVSTLVYSSTNTSRVSPSSLSPQRTGITQKEQNLLVGAYKVRRTLIDEGVVTNDVVSYFNTIDAAELLYEFRTIPVELRGIMVRSCPCNF